MPFNLVEIRRKLRVKFPSLPLRLFKVWNRSTPPYVCWFIAASEREVRLFANRCLHRNGTRFCRNGANLTVTDVTDSWEDEVIGNRTDHSNYHYGRPLSRRQFAARQKKLRRSLAVLLAGPLTGLVSWKGCYPHRWQLYDDWQGRTGVGNVYL